MAKTCWECRERQSALPHTKGGLNAQNEAAREALPTPDPATEPIGRFHAWWRGDPLLALPELHGLSIAPTDDARFLAELVNIAAPAIEERMQQGHRAWVAWLAGMPVSWGWVATDALAIGELGTARQLPPGNRYLWDFFTTPPWRGRGIYPRLLQTIIVRDPEAQRFWVGHDFANTPSARGIARAGFREVGVVYRQMDGEFALVPAESLPLAEAASTLFGIPLAGRPSPRTA
jgi:GNAT superfamily N-acetyltransferase